MRFLAIALSLAAANSWSQAELEQYNVVWTSPSKDASGSMPIGNGEVGLNVWVEEGGDLLMYVSRTDSFSEACRLLKVGKVRVSISPNPFEKGKPFKQTLDLRSGVINIQAEDWNLSVFVDSHNPIAWVTGKGKTPRRVTVGCSNWRTERKLLKGEELDSSWTMKGAPFEVWESADIIGREPDAVAVWHRNESSVVPFTLKQQGISQFEALAGDPLKDRSFGIRASSQSLSKNSPTTLTGETTSFNLQVTAHCEQTTAFEEKLTAVSRKANNASQAKARTAKWWNAFWDRSYIFVEGQREITEAYILQRWISACGGRGNYPIKFNGSIFTVEPNFLGPKHNPDWRRWGDSYWWQNTRLPYHPMLMSGDFEMMDSLFGLYEKTLPLCRARAKEYWGAEGVYYPETMTMFGSYANNDYGWDRTGLKSNDIQCPWWMFAWNQGPELLMLMLDRYAYQEDEKFLRERLLPMSREVLKYFESRFVKDGKMRITPTQSAETYWKDVVNDTPSVAGLHAVLNELLKLRTTKSERDWWLKLRASLPPVPVNDGKILAAAESFNPQRSNVENPEFYAIWPFRLFTLSKNPAIAKETFNKRIEKANNGWQYDGQVAALSGLAEEAQKTLLSKVRNSNAAFRFPAMWGPNYDWLPDQCHGGNIMLTLQSMLLYDDGATMKVFPAWPKEWNVKFKLRARNGQVVRGEFAKGKGAWKVEKAK